MFQIDRFICLPPLLLSMKVSDLEARVEAATDYCDHTVENVEIEADTGLLFADMSSVSSNFIDRLDLPKTSKWFVTYPDDAEPLAEGTNVRLGVIFEESLEQKPDYYCEIHEVVEPHYKGTNDEHCAMCYEEARIEEEYLHQATRDPMIEPW